MLLELRLRVYNFKLGPYVHGFTWLHHMPLVQVVKENATWNRSKKWFENLISVLDLLGRNVSTGFISFTCFILTSVLVSGSSLRTYFSHVSNKMNFDRIGMKLPCFV